MADLTAVYSGYIQQEAVTFLYKLAKIKSIHIYTISGRSFDSRPPAQEQVCGCATGRLTARCGTAKNAK